MADSLDHQILDDFLWRVAPINFCPGLVLRLSVVNLSRVGFGSLWPGSRKW